MILKSPLNKLVEYIHYNIHHSFNKNQKKSLFFLKIRKIMHDTTGIRIKSGGFFAKRCYIVAEYH